MHQLINKEQREKRSNACENISKPKGSLLLGFENLQVNDDIQTYFVGQPHPLINVMFRS